MLVNSFRRVSNIAIVATICICLLVSWTQIQSSILLVQAQIGIHDVPREISNGGGDGIVKKIVLIAHDALLQVAPDNQLKPGGVLYEAMTFNGTIPGPWISINHGDILEITLVNQADAVHSIDLHAAYGPSQALSGSLEPGQQITS
jgi:hypothetical protein